MRNDSITKYFGLISDKRALDFGLLRGFSGTQAAKHLLGLTSANLATGPGRRRRRRRMISYSDNF